MDIGNILGSSSTRGPQDLTRGADKMQDEAFLAQLLEQLTGGKGDLADVLGQLGAQGSNAAGNGNCSSNCGGGSGGCGSNANASGCCATGQKLASNLQFQ